MWVPRIELRYLGLASSAYNSLVILLALFCPLLPPILRLLLFFLLLESLNLKKKNVLDLEMAYMIRELVVLPENLSLVPSTHVRQFTTTVTPTPGNTKHLAAERTGIHILKPTNAHTHTPCKHRRSGVSQGQ